MDATSDYFVIQRSQLNTNKIFVEFYLPKYQALFNQLRQGKYPLVSLRTLSGRIFDGPFGSNRKVDMYQKTGIPYIRVKDVLPNDIDTDKLVYISREKHKELERSRVIPGNVLVTIAGRVGTAAVFPDSLNEGNITGHIVGIDLPKNINPHYLATFLNSPLGQFQFSILSHRTTRPELNLSEVGQVLVPLPPLTVQDYIAQLMQSAHTARQEQLGMASNLLETMSAWAFNVLQISLVDKDFQHNFLTSLESFHGKRWDVAFYQNSTIDFSNAEWIPFNEYIDVCRNTLNPSKQPQQEFYYVAIQGMKNDSYSSDENACRLTGSEISGIVQTFRGGDILLARLGPCLSNKKSVIVPKCLNSGCGSPEFLVIRPRDGVDNRFLLWLVKEDFLVKEMLPKTKGGTPSRMRLHAEELLGLRVPKATIAQQEIIGTEFERRRSESKRLCRKTEVLVAETEAQVERMILGKEETA